VKIHLKYMVSVTASASLFAAGIVSAFDRPMISVPLIEMMQEGKAKVSPDKKTIIDDKGKFVAKETSQPKPAEKKLVNEYLTETGERNPDDDKRIPDYEKYYFTCNYKCAIMVKKCYQDDVGYKICVNICDKESFICDQHEY
jgi:hypothetical protein